MLEDEVDDSFYWNKLSIDELRKLDIDDITFKWNSKVKRFVFNEKIDLNMTYSLNTYNNSVSCIHHTITTPHNVLFILHKCKIRKLTPKECWRLMGFCPRNEYGSFDDECFEKAKWMHDTFYLKGGKKCSAKLKVAKEKPKHEDTETYVLCTTKDSTDMEILKTITSKSARMPESEKPVSVNIAIDRLEELELSECATNIIRCIDYMETRFTLIRRKDAYLMDIIVQAKTDSTNTEKCMKITTESNLDQNRLYTILTLSVLIIESRIFTATIQRANISGCIMLIEDSSKNVLLKISNLKMECIRERVSNSELYKQAGNSIVVDCLVHILKNLKLEVDHE